MTRLSTVHPRLYGAIGRAINAACIVLLALSASSVTMADEPEHIILAFGDSLIAGYGLSNADSFPARLESALREQGHEVRVVNGGVSGDTSRAGLSRVDWLFAEKPDLMILELGANDGLRGLPPEDTEKNLAAIIEKAQAAGIPVLLAGMLAPPNLGREYGDAFNAIYPRLAEKHEVALYPFFLEGVAADPALNQGDGMHPNPAGVDVIVERILPSVIQILPSGGA